MNTSVGGFNPWMQPPLFDFILGEYIANVYVLSPS